MDLDDFEAKLKELRQQIAADTSTATDTNDTNEFLNDDNFFTGNSSSKFNETTVDFASRIVTDAKPHMLYDKNGYSMNTNVIDSSVTIQGDNAIQNHFMTDTRSIIPQKPTVVEEDVDQRDHNVEGYGGYISRAMELGPLDKIDVSESLDDVVDVNEVKPEKNMLYASYVSEGSAGSFEVPVEIRETMRSIDEIADNFSSLAHESVASRNSTTQRSYSSKNLTFDSSAFLESVPGIQEEQHDPTEYTVFDFEHGDEQKSDSLIDNTEEPEANDKDFKEMSSRINSILKAVGSALSTTPISTDQKYINERNISNVSQQPMFDAHEESCIQDSDYSKTQHSDLELIPDDVVARESKIRRLEEGDNLSVHDKDIQNHAYTTVALSSFSTYHNEPLHTPTQISSMPTLIKEEDVTMTQFTSSLDHSGLDETKNDPKHQLPLQAKAESGHSALLSQKVESLRKVSRSYSSSEEDDSSTSDDSSVNDAIGHRNRVQEIKPRISASIDTVSNDAIIGSTAKLEFNEDIGSNFPLKGFKKLKILGEGQFGQVWLVMDTDHNPFAAKLFAKYDLIENDEVDMIIHETEMHKRVHDHPFIVKLVCAFQDANILYLIQEFAQGGELFSVIQRYSALNKRNAQGKLVGMPEIEVKFYAACIADAIAHMHAREIAYRDLKPENCMIDRYGYPLVIDFGLAKHVPDKTFTFCGTPRFLPPEAINPSEEGYDCTIDNWSLGVLIYEMLAGGINPFFAEGISELELFTAVEEDDFTPLDEDAISTAASSIVDGLLTKDPSKRLGFSSNDEILRHKWFHDIDLNALRIRSVKAPWIPETKNLTDTACFEDWSHLQDRTQQNQPKLSLAEEARFEYFPYSSAVDLEELATYKQRFIHIEQSITSQNSLLPVPDGVEGNGTGNYINTSNHVNESKLAQNQSEMDVTSKEIDSSTNQEISSSLDSHPDHHCSNDKTRLAPFSLAMSETDFCENEDESEQLSETMSSRIEELLKSISNIKTTSPQSPETVSSDTDDESERFNNQRLNSSNRNDVDLLLQLALGTADMVGQVRRQDVTELDFDSLHYESTHNNEEIELSRSQNPNIVYEASETEVEKVISQIPSTPHPRLNSNDSMALTELDDLEAKLLFNDHPKSNIVSNQASRSSDFGSITNIDDQNFSSVGSKGLDDSHNDNLHNSADVAFFSPLNVGLNNKIASKLLPITPSMGSDPSEEEDVYEVSSNDSEESEGNVADRMKQTLDETLITTTKAQQPQVNLNKDDHLPLSSRQHEDSSTNDGSLGLDDFDVNHLVPHPSHRISQLNTESMMSLSAFESARDFYRDSMVFIPQRMSMKADGTSVTQVNSNLIPEVDLAPSSKQHQDDDKSRNRSDGSMEMDESDDKLSSLKPMTRVSQLYSVSSGMMSFSEYGSTRDFSEHDNSMRSDVHFFSPVKDQQRESMRGRLGMTRNEILAPVLEAKFDVKSTTDKEISSEQYDTTNSNIKLFPQVNLASSSKHQDDDDEISTDDGSIELDEFDDKVPSLKPMSRMSHVQASNTMSFSEYGSTRDFSEHDNSRSDAQFFSPVKDREGMRKRLGITTNEILAPLLESKEMKPDDPPISSPVVETLSNLDFVSILDSDDTMVGNFPLKGFRKLKILGEGQYGQVWLVMDKKQNPYAVKMFSKYDLIENDEVEMIVHETEMHLQVHDHPFIVKLVCAFQDDNILYMMQDFAQGGELFTVIQKYSELNEKSHDDGKRIGMPEYQAKFYAVCITDAIAHMHKKEIAYRDLKPENCMIDQYGYPLVIDFGYAKHVPDKTYTFCGTPRFLPPEAINPENGYDCTLDHWSLGVLIYEMLAGGMSPFYEEGMSEVELFTAIQEDDYPPLSKDTVSATAADLVACLLVKDPFNRLGSSGTESILQHEWFHQTNLSELRKRSIVAPWIPDTKNVIDTSCFDDWSHLEDKAKQRKPKLKPHQEVKFKSIPYYNSVDFDEVARQRAGLEREKTSESTPAREKHSENEKSILQGDKTQTKFGGGALKTRKALLYQAATASSSFRSTMSDVSIALSESTPFNRRGSYVSLSDFASAKDFNSDDSLTGSGTSLPTNNLTIAESHSAKSSRKKDTVLDDTLSETINMCPDLDIDNPNRISTNNEEELTTTPSIQQFGEDIGQPSIAYVIDSKSNFFKHQTKMEAVLKSFDQSLNLMMSSRTNLYQPEEIKDTFSDDSSIPSELDDLPTLPKYAAHSDLRASLSRILGNESMNSLKIDRDLGLIDSCVRDDAITEKSKVAQLPMTRNDSVVEEANSTAVADSADNDKKTDTIGGTSKSSSGTDRDRVYDSQHTGTTEPDLEVDTTSYLELMKRIQNEGFNVLDHDPNSSLDHCDQNHMSDMTTSENAWCDNNIDESEGSAMMASKIDEMLRSSGDGTISSPTSPDIVKAEANSSNHNNNNNMKLKSPPTRPQLPKNLESSEVDLLLQLAMGTADMVGQVRRDNVAGLDFDSLHYGDVPKNPKDESMTRSKYESYELEAKGLEALLKFSSHEKSNSEPDGNYGQNNVNVDNHKKIQESQKDNNLHNSEDSAFFSPLNIGFNNKIESKLLPTTPSLDSDPTETEDVYEISSNESESSEEIVTDNNEPAIDETMTSRIQQQLQVKVTPKEDDIPLSTQQEDSSTNDGSLGLDDFDINHPVFHRPSNRISQINTESMMSLSAFESARDFYRDSVVLSPQRMSMRDDGTNTTLANSNLLPKVNLTPSSKQDQDDDDKSNNRSDGSMEMDEFDDKVSSLKPMTRVSQLYSASSGMMSFSEYGSTRDFSEHDNSMRSDVHFFSPVKDQQRESMRGRLGMTRNEILAPVLETESTTKSATDKDISLKHQDDNINRNNPNNGNNNNRSDGSMEYDEFDDKVPSLKPMTRISQQYTSGMMSFSEYGSTRDFSELDFFSPVKEPREGIRGRMGLIGTCTSSILEPPILVPEEDCIEPESTSLQSSNMLRMKDFKRLRILGEGQFGQVWLAMDHNQNPYAIKMFSKYDLIENDEVDMIVHETQMHEQVHDHPFIVKLVSYFQDSDMVYMVQEFAQGGELFTVIQKYAEINEQTGNHVVGMPENQAKFYTACITDAIAHMHKKDIAYRDLKPENCMIDRYGYPLVIDFGYAKHVPDKTYTFCGTPRFLPPEAINPSEHGYDCTLDHWSLGVLIYEMLSGGLSPFYEEGMSEVELFTAIEEDDYPPLSKETVSATAADMVACLLVKDPTKRLGATGTDAILQHEWLNELNLIELRKRSVAAPWIPDTKNVIDTSCFDDWSHLEDKAAQKHPKLKPSQEAKFQSFPY